MQPRTVFAIRDALADVTLAIGVAMVVGSPVLFEQVFRATALKIPEHVWYGTPDDFVHPSDRIVDVFGLGASHRMNDFELTDYVGWAVLAALVVVCWQLRRRFDVRVAALTLISAAILVLGRGSSLREPLPWAVVEKLPLLSNLVPVRMSFVMWVCIAFLSARAVDEVRASRTAFRGIGAGLLALAAVSLVPHAAPTYRLDVPTFFTSASDLRIIPRGSPVLVLPIATSAHDQAMLWQAESGFRFSMPGGYALRAINSSKVSYDAPPSPLYDLATIIRAGRSPTPGQLAAARIEWRDEHFAAVFVVHGGPNTDLALRTAASLTGHGPAVSHDGVTVFLP
jgi:hypothetical protein